MGDDREIFLKLKILSLKFGIIPQVLYAHFKKKSDDIRVYNNFQIYTENYRNHLK